MIKHSLTLVCADFLYKGYQSISWCKFLPWWMGRSRDLCSDDRPLAFAANDTEAGQDFHLSRLLFLQGFQLTVHLKLSDLKWFWEMLGFVGSTRVKFRDSHILGKYFPWAYTTSSKRMASNKFGVCPHQTTVFSVPLSPLCLLIQLVVEEVCTAHIL